MNTQEIIKDAIAEMADATMNLPDNTDAAFTIVKIDNQYSLAIAGREDDIILALAEAMINDPKLKDFVIDALTIASSATCDCEACRVNRADGIMSDPNIN